MKRICLALVFLCAYSFVFAQDEEKTEEKRNGFHKENLFFGGNFGLTFGDYTLINISPQLGYRLNKYFAAGAGINFQYVSEKQRDVYNNPLYKTSIGVAGLNLFGRAYPIQYFMLQLQPEVNYRFGNIKTYYNGVTEKTNLDALIVPSILAGGGIVIPSDRSALIISMMYDLLKDVNSPYGTKPFVNFTYNINLH